MRNTLFQQIKAYKCWENWDILFVACVTAWINIIPIFSLGLKSTITCAAMPPSHPHPPPSSGSKGGAVVRALASHQCGPGSANPGVDGICGLSLLLVLSLAPRGFSPGTPVFPSPQKPTFPNSNSARNQVNEEPLCGCATCKSLFIYLFNLEVCMMFDTWTYSRTSI